MALGLLDELFVFGRPTLRCVLVFLVYSFPSLGLNVKDLEIIHFVSDFMDTSEYQNVAVLVDCDLMATFLERLVRDCRDITAHWSASS